MDVMYPMAVVGTAARGLYIYTLEGSPSEYRVSCPCEECLSSPSLLPPLPPPHLSICLYTCMYEVQKLDSPLKYQHRCVSIFKEKQGYPTGFALGSIEGRVAIHYANPANP